MSLDHVSPEQLSIVGASIRSAADSARRGGFLAWGADLFSDRDTDCESIRIREFAQLPLELAGRPNIPWMYTGGLENSPDLVDRLAGIAPLIGIPGRALRSVRHPETLAATLAAAGLFTPAVTRRDPHQSGWLVKPLASAGGRGIRFWEPGDFLDGKTMYLQRFVAGKGVGAAFLAVPGAVQLLGVTEPWDECAGVGLPAVPSFQYQGSIGPIPIPTSEVDEWLRIGNCLASQFDLKGVFGVDAIRSPRGIEVVEVNPRFTASMELIERATGQSTVRQHWNACQFEALPSFVAQPTTKIYGKRIAYASHSIRISRVLSDHWARLAGGKFEPSIADIPRPGTILASGEPVCTVLTTGDTVAQVIRDLSQRVDTICREFTRDQHP